MHLLARTALITMAALVAMPAMATTVVTGSAGGLGRAAAQSLLGGGHEVVVHARSAERLAAVDDLVGVIANVRSAAQRCAKNAQTINWIW